MVNIHTRAQIGIAPAYPLNKIPILMHPHLYPYELLGVHSISYDFTSFNDRKCVSFLLNRLD